MTYLVIYQSKNNFFTLTSCPTALLLVVGFFLIDSFLVLSITGNLRYSAGTSNGDAAAWYAQLQLERSESDFGIRCASKVRYGHPYLLAPATNAVLMGI